MEKVVITGVTGFIGGALAERLLNNGVIVYGIGRSLEKMQRFLQYKNFFPIIAAYSDYSKLHEIINDSAFDIIFHFAWQGYGYDSNCLNVQSKNLLASESLLLSAFKMKCKKFVYAGTCYEYQMKHINDIEVYNNSYNLIKNAVKNYLKMECAKKEVLFCSGMITNAFGVGDYSKRSVNTMTDKLSKGIALDLISFDIKYDWTYIDDVVDGFIAIAQKGKDGGEYCICHRPIPYFGELITEARDVINPEAKLNFNAYDDTAFIDFSKINIDALYNDTGFECKADFRESILKTAEWVKTLNWD